MTDWITHKRTPVLDRGKFLQVEDHTVELPGGQIIEDWSWVILPEYANIVVETTSGDYLVFRQSKYAIEGESLALPGGYLEPDEAPLAAAQRELLEETGYEAAHWYKLGTFRVDANRGAGMAHLFLATQAQKITERNADDLEAQEIVFLSRDDLQAALLKGEFKVIAWAMGVALALLQPPDS